MKVLWAMVFRFVILVATLSVFIWSYPELHKFNVIYNAVELTITVVIFLNDVGLTHMTNKAILLYENHKDIDTHKKNIQQIREDFILDDLMPERTEIVLGSLVGMAIHCEEHNENAPPVGVDLLK